MTYKLQFSKQAAADLDETFEYISAALKAPMAAQNLMAKIDRAIHQLTDMPEAHPLFADDTLQMLGYRKLVIDSFIVVYSVNKSNQTIAVVRVFYGRQDYLKHLK